MSAPSTSSEQTRSEKLALRESKDVAKALQDSQLEFKKQVTEACSSLADTKRNLMLPSHGKPCIVPIL